jgi:hypothetical protein
MEALGFTAVATGLRLYFNTFEGFTFRYWGDFEFFVFLTIVNVMYLKLKLVPMLKYYGIAFVARELVRQMSPTKVEDVPIEKRPKDVVITFKRCTQCSNLYDTTQVVSFIVFAYALVRYRKELVQVLSQ